MNTKKNWFALGIIVAAEAAEAVEFALNELDALGTEINNLGKNPTAALTVNGYFHELPDEPTIRRTLDEALRIYDFAPAAIQSIDSHVVADLDWLLEWKKHWKPTETGKFIVAPSWESVEHSDKIVIRIEPNMAFGTGTHETTRLCLSAIEEHYESGMSFLDVGTGTGILAIAAAKLNGESQISDAAFTGCDTDFDSITIARENAALNQVGEAVEFFVGSLSVDTPRCEFVCANITIDVILPILPLLIEKSERILVLSGILNEQESMITDALGKLQIEDFTIENQGEWISLTIKRGDV